MNWLWGNENHVVKIDMGGNKDFAALVAYRNIFTSAEVVADARDSAPLLAKAMAISEIMHNLAGPAAQSKFDVDLGIDWFFWTHERFYDDQLPNTDMGKAIAAAMALHGEPVEPGDFNISRRALRFLEMVAKWTEEAIFDPKVWPIVEALGTRLETQQTMQGSTAIRIMEQAAGDGWNHPIRLFALGSKWKRRTMPKA